MRQAVQGQSSIPGDQRCRFEQSPRVLEGGSGEKEKIKSLDF